MKVLVTGAAGFIGFHVCNRLLDRGDEVVGVDSFNNLPYGTSIKKDRYLLLCEKNFAFIEQDLSESTPNMDGIDVVCHLAATAGVRMSIEYPSEYIKANICATTNLLEACKNSDVQNFVFASSSSVYGLEKSIPFSEDLKCDTPVSLYAATKRSCELIAHTYSHLFDMNITGLRFFTVYGPWGRPDMALFLFAKNILEGKPIDVYNHGDMMRDFTYVDDIVDGIVRCLDKPSKFEIFNIGCGSPQSLLDFVSTIEECCERKAEMNMMSMQQGDVHGTHANIDKIRETHGYEPTTPISVGIPKTIEWFKEYYGY